MDPQPWPGLVVVAVVSDDVLAFVAGSLGVVIIVLVALLVWRRGGPHHPTPPE